jgi:signal transduction histidine kinase
VFERTRRNLTLVMGGMIALILVMATLIYYFILAGTLNNNQSTRLADLKQKTVSQWERHFAEKIHLDPKDNISNRTMDWEHLQSDELESLVTPDGKVMVSPSTDSSMTGHLQDWALNRVDQGPSGKWIVVNNGGQKETYLVATYTLSPAGGQFWGALRITDNLRLLNQMKLFLLLLSVFFLTVASAVAYLLSGRAMVPIKRSFFRQVEFTADASHELRTPLSVMLSSIEVLEEHKNTLPEFEQTVFEDLKDEVLRMTRLTESLLTLARNDSITPNANWEVLNIGELASQVVRSMQPAAQKKDISMIVAETPATQIPVQVRGDEDQLRQLVYILVDNALKYTTNGGKVCVEYGQLKDNKTILRVTDTGIGIPAEEIPLIFERFYRVDKARSRELGGTGLGLSIASEIVKMHKASFHVTSHLEEGSRFEVVFLRIPNR